MTGKEVETVAVLLKRVRERSDDVLKAASDVGNRAGTADAADVQEIATDIAKGMQSLAAALEMVTIEVAELRRRIR